MLLDKIYSELCIILIYSLLEHIVECQSETFSRKMCLEKALTFQAILSQNKCPYLEDEKDRNAMRCSIICNGTFTTIQDNKCVAYNIIFKFNETMISKLKDYRCISSNCSTEVIDFECTFNKEYSGSYLNNTSDSKDEHLNQQDTNRRNRSSITKEDRKQRPDGGSGLCNDPGTTVVISISCLVGGSLIGISAFVLIKRLRTSKQILQTPPVFYQPNYGDNGDLSGERTVTIASPLETEYADIEETIRLVAKAIQVPSYKEDSSSETRSRENIYHHLSFTEDSTKKENIDVISSDSIPDSFADDIILSSKGSPSFKSVVICAESSSSKSNGNSKVSPTGSAGSDKYYALEKEYLIFNSSSNGNT